MFYLNLYGYVREDMSVKTYLTNPVETYAHTLVIWRANMRKQPGTGLDAFFLPLLLGAALLLAACAERGAAPAPPPAERPVYEGLDGPKPIVVYMSIDPYFMSAYCEEKANPLCRRKARYPYYVGYMVIDKYYRLSWHQKASYPQYQEEGVLRADSQVAREILGYLGNARSMVTYGLPPDDSFVPEFSRYYLCKPDERYPFSILPLSPYLPPDFYYLPELKKYMEEGKPPGWDRQSVPPHMR